VIPVQFELLVLTGTITEGEALELTNRLYWYEWIRLDRQKRWP